MRSIYATKCKLPKLPVKCANYRSCKEFNFTNHVNCGSTMFKYCYSFVRWYLAADWPCLFACNKQVEMPFNNMNNNMSNLDETCLQR